jgi:hypothetical protein
MPTCNREHDWRRNVSCTKEDTAEAHRTGIHEDSRTGDTWRGYYPSPYEPVLAQRDNTDAPSES